MDDRRKTIAAITIIIGVGALILIVIGVLLAGNKTVSPVPDEGAIKIIFVSPTPVVIASPSASLTPTKAVTPTKKPSPKPTVTQKPSPASSASATPTP
ncbi:MAG: hypothetical protein AAB961_00435 [Patescibacteria group bacterium]